MVLPSRVVGKPNSAQRRRRETHRTCNSVALVIVLIIFVSLKPSSLTTPPQLEWMIHEESEVVMGAIKIRQECIRHVREQHKLAWPELLVPEENATILLVDPVMHESVGDTMLTFAEVEYLSKLGWDVVECDCIQSSSVLPKCTDELLDELMQVKGVQAAIWHAGSTWRELWRTTEGHPTETFVSILKFGYHIICLPQSLDYQDLQAEQTDSITIQRNIMEGMELMDLTTAANIEKSKARITFSWREQDSYERALILYPFVENKLVPDISFQLGPFNSTKNYWKQVDILLLLREDVDPSFNGERHDDVIRGYLAETATGSSLDFNIVDWNDRLKIFHSEETFFGNTSIELLSLGRVVIADRLNASILAYLSGLPLIYLDQANTRLASTLSLALDDPLCGDQTTSLWSRAATVREAVHIAAEMLNTYPIP
jgi:exopolysaccharide biosynthesis predicted pyruvyltransferase EpsI